MSFKSLQNQIIFVFLVLILGIQLIGLIPIQISINQNARNAAEQELQVGESVFINILEQDTNSLVQGAKILAADYGFRDSVASEDSETILSALNNHQSRINADIAIFYANRTNKTIISGNVSEKNAIAASKKLIKAYTSDSKQLFFEVFKNQPYQLVAVPVKAPLTIGWVVMGFEIDNTLAQKLNLLSKLEVSFIQKSTSNQWESTASTLSIHQQDALVSKLSKRYDSTIKRYELNIHDEVFDSSVLTVHQGDSLLLVVLQKSLSQATAQYNALKRNLLILIMLGLLIFTIVTIYISKYITSPIATLSETANQLALGHYDIDISTNRKDEIGRLSHAFSSMRDAIALREKKVTQLAFWDEVTGLQNRAAFMQQLNNALIVHRENNQSLAVLIFNISRFKQINKIIGRQLADEVLKQVGTNIQNAVRQSTDLVVRLGADEYAVLLPEADLEVAHRVVNNILKSFERALTLNEQQIDINAVVGISIFPQHGQTYERLLINAETALQEAKQKKIEVAVYNDTQDLGAQDNLTFASELKAAIQHNHLALFLQPKVNIQNQKVYAAEALVRWIHPEKGFIFPDQFIPFAEQTGIIPQITLWMLNEACKVHAQFLQQGITVSIAVNIAMQDLIDQDFPAKIATMLNSHGVGANAIELEVTESSMMDDPERAEKTLLKLSEMGLQLSIDDFGTGYSSLSYLKRLPVNALKIDRSFVMHIDSNANDVSIVRSTIDLAHNLNLKVVAEGIENEAAWKLLEKMGCDYGQGYWMGKPMAVNKYPEWLKAWQADT